MTTSILGDYWPGIQIYYPPVKYAPSLGIYEDLEQAAQRFRKHGWNTTAHTLLFDLEDGCRQKEMSRDLLRLELPKMPRKKEVQVAVRINPFRTDEYDKDLQLIRDLSDHFDVVMLAKAGEAYGAPEIRDLSAALAGFNHRITIQPIIEHPKSLKIAPELVAGGDANLVGQTVLAALRQATESSRRYREQQRAALTGGLKLPEF